MTGHQCVRMLPPRFRSEPVDPVTKMRIAGPVDADFLGPEHVPAERKIGSGEPVGDDVAPPLQMRVEDAPGGFSALAELGEHGWIRIRGKRAQIPIRRRIARELVVVEEEPAKYLPPLVLVRRTELAEPCGQ